jgi:N-acetylglucosamine-6-phosphate deacetylase
MDVALRNLVAIGLPLEEAALRLATLPADYLGCSEIGRITRGAWADFVLCDSGLQLLAVYRGGKRCDLS